MAQGFSAGFVNAPTDTRRVKFAKVLLFYQSLPDASRANDLQPTDTRRTILVKTLKAINNHV